MDSPVQTLSIDMCVWSGGRGGLQNRLGQSESVCALCGMVQRSAHGILVPAISVRFRLPPHRIRPMEQDAGFLILKYWFDSNMRYQPYSSKGKDWSSLNSRCAFDSCIRHLSP